MNTPIKSYAQIVTENIQLKEEKRALINQIVTEKLKHSIAFNALKKLMDDKINWYEDKLQKSTELNEKAIAELGRLNGKVEGIRI